MSKKDNNARQQARAQLRSIQAMLQAVDNAKNDADFDAALQTLREDPLTVEHRGPWVHVNQEPNDMQEPMEYKMLLCTGGPAVQLRGDLDDNGIPINICLEYQDWFTPWKIYRTNAFQEQQLLRYANYLYVG